ncbi:hypothetical protein [Singulisphaera sp. PoT]|uniref:hypothetical protein n=1 Tax=Singulisphaera sp. PoT TaxID=3411797 RepID=UPI003BF55201
MAPTHAPASAPESTPAPAAAPVAAPALANPAEQPPVNILLKSPADFGEFLKSLQRPDFILMSGEELKNRLERAREGGKPSDPWAVVIRSVAVRGEVVADLANLSLELNAVLSSPDAAWVPIRLDNLTVIEAREGSKVLPLKVAQGGGWQVELRGAGEHKLQVDLKVRLRSSTEGQHLDLAIPEAASTEVRFDVDQVLKDATATSSESLELTPIREGNGTRVSAHLSPRSRLDVSWRVESDPAAQLPPLLTMQGEIAIDLDPGSFRTRSSWVVRSVRGASRSLEFRLDPDDEVLELSLDGQPVPAGLERVENGTRLTIQLTEPLRPGPTKRLVMATRRNLSLQSAERITFGGFSLANAKEQNGAIGIAQGGNLFISGTTGRGLRQIDPRTGLPDDLRTRPSTVLAYQFVDQPFELTLRVDASPPLVRTDARTNVKLDAGQARVDTWLKYEAANGRLFDLHVRLPRGLELESVGPKEMVESSQLIPDAEGSRMLTIRLASRPQERSSIEIHVTGHQAIDASKPVDIALFQPRESASGGGRVAVVAERNLTVDLVDDEASNVPLASFRPARQEIPIDWPLSQGEPLRVSPALWLNYDGNPAAMPLKIAVHPRSVSATTNLFVDVSRRGIETRQETECSVQFGTLDHLDIEIPHALVRRWELESDDVASPIDLGMNSSGGRLVRLKFAEPVTDKVMLVFRFRLPRSLPLSSGKPVDLLLDWLRIRSSNTNVRMTAMPESGIRLQSRSVEWSPVEDEDPALEDGPALSARLSLATTDVDGTRDPMVMSASALTLTTLPNVVAHHLWLRTIRGLDQELRTTARYRLETQSSNVSIALPNKSVLIQARVGGETISQIEQLPQASSYRFQLPERFRNGPIAFEVEYVSPRPEGTQATWQPPQLLDGGIVQQTFWEIRLPSSHALVGVPEGWTDENHWYWDRYVWKRKPWVSAATLASWIGITSPTSKSTEDLVEDGREGYHNYMFGRPGAPSEFRPLIFSRAGLVGLWSGSALAIGVIVLYLGSWLRIVVLAILALGLSICLALLPSATILALQSAAIGFVFTLVAAVMKRQIERPRPLASTLFGEPAPPSATSALPGSSIRSMGVVGSDESTAIRVRPASTVDHLPNVASISSEASSGSGRTGVGDDD